MNIHVQRLSRIVQHHPSGDELPDWSRMESEFGISFPSDFRDFTRVFGAGLLDGYVSISVPDAENRFIDLIRRSEEYLHSLNGVRGTLPVQLAYPLESRIGGLIVWGVNEDADLCCWIPEGDPDEWRVGVYSRTFNDWMEYQCGFAEFLVGVMSGEIESPFARSDFPSRLPFFESWRRRLEEFQES